MVNESLLSVVLNVFMLVAGVILIIKGKDVRKAAKPIGNTASSNQTSISTTLMLVGAMLVLSQFYSLLEIMIL